MVINGYSYKLFTLFRFDLSITRCYISRLPVAHTVAVADKAFFQDEAIEYRHGVGFEGFGVFA